MHLNRRLYTQRIVISAKVLNSKMYRLMNKTQSCNSNMAARTGRYLKSMGTLMKTYKLIDMVPITILHFLAMFKRVCDSNEVSKGMGL